MSTPNPVCRCIPGSAVFCNKCGCANNPSKPGLKQNGDYCGNPVVPGMHRCHMHGAGTPTAKLKAENAMALLRMPAIEALYTVLDAAVQLVQRHFQDPCPHCGYPMRSDPDDIQNVVKACAVVTKQAQTILDRTGIGPTAKLEIRQSDGDLDLKLLTPEERACMIAKLTELRELKESFRARLNRIAGISSSPTPLLP